MCGIAGIVEFEDNCVEPGLLLAMGRIIAHRGPDDEGYVLIAPSDARYRDYAGSTSPAKVKARMPILSATSTFDQARIGLCHRRFSIIDLSEAGHQPFFDREGSCCVVFNGEIYNYVEVRDELAAQGIQFHTQSDTEVLTEAYKYWGPNCFSKLNGFWAIALYDFKNRQLILSRDRIGKSPLYWTRVGSRLYFASEIKALLQVPEVQQRIKVNEESIYHWVAYGRKDLNFTTCFEGVHSLPSASWAVADQNFPNDVRTFWNLPKERLKESDISAGEAATELRELLQDAVRIRLRADVPVSVELSGGMDSSVLVALAAQVQPGRITTHTVRFPQKQHNEEPFARSVARRYNTDYRVLESPLANFWSQVLAFTYLEEEPYHSPNLQTNQVIWTQMRSMGTKVSLNGAGGDENFAGYGWYFALFQVENLLEGRFSTYLSNALRYSDARTRFRCLSVPIVRLAAGATKRLLPNFQARNRRKVSYYKGKIYPTSCLEPLTLSESLYSDMTNTLMPYWLRSGNRGCMGVPLEPRGPFLDYRVVELAFRLPITYLVRDGWHKWILRKAVEDLLPKDVVWRRRKMGYPFPYGQFYSENNEIVETILDNSHNPYIDLGKRGQFRSDWTILSFLLWYEMFLNDNVSLFKKIEAMARRMRPVEEYGFTPQFLSTARFS